MPRKKSMISSKNMNKSMKLFFKRSSNKNPKKLLQRQKRDSKKIAQATSSVIKYLEKTQQGEGIGGTLNPLYIINNFISGVNEVVDNFILLRLLRQILYGIDFIISLPFDYIIFPAIQYTYDVSRFIILTSARLGGYVFRMWATGNLVLNLTIAIPGLFFDISKIPNPLNYFSYIKERFDTLKNSSETQGFVKDLKSSIKDNIPISETLNQVKIDNAEYLSKFGYLSDAVKFLTDVSEISWTRVALSFGIGFYLNNYLVVNQASSAMTQWFLEDIIGYPIQVFEFTIEQTIRGIWMQGGYKAIGILVAIVFVSSIFIWFITPPIVKHIYLNAPDNFDYFADGLKLISKNFSYFYNSTEAIAKDFFQMCKLLRIPYLIIEFITIIDNIYNFIFKNIISFEIQTFIGGLRYLFLDNPLMLILSGKSSIPKSVLTGQELIDWYKALNFHKEIFKLYTESIGLILNFDENFVENASNEIMTNAWKNYQAAKQLLTKDIAQRTLFERVVIHFIFLIKYTYTILQYYFFEYQDMIKYFFSIFISIAIISFCFNLLTNVSGRPILLDKQSMEILVNEYIIADLCYREMMKPIPAMGNLVNKIPKSSKFYPVLKIPKTTDMRQLVLDKIVDLSTQFNHFSKYPPTDEKDLKIWNDIIPPTKRRLKDMQSSLFYLVSNGNPKFKNIIDKIDKFQEKDDSDEVNFLPLNRRRGVASTYSID